MRKLIVCRRNIYSQNGEDGVTAEVLERLNISSGWFCEFGAWDGKYGSNTYALLKQGWHGVMIEGDAKKFLALQRTAKNYPDTLLIQQAYVSFDGGDSSLDNLLAKTPIPADFDVLSIDIDSYDFHVWNSLNCYRPKLVIIEIDSSTPPGEKYVYEGHRLTSFSAMLELGISKNYTLVCHTGNLFFVANEYVELLALDRETLDTPESIFIKDWVSPSWLQVLCRKIKNMTWQRAITKIDNIFRRN